jgi:protein-disulfide isomerase
MHDYLFEHQQALDDDHLAKYATKLALDVHRFNQDMSKHIYADVFIKTCEVANRVVEGTPTFFINGVHYDESWDLETLLRAIKNTMR